MRRSVEGKSDKADKRKPIEERIAALLGKSAYVDLRDGVGGTNPLRLMDQDFAAALGMVAFVMRKVTNTEGRLYPMVLETHYGSTLMHLQPIRRAWEDQERKAGESRESIVLTRFGGELAIRQLASIRYGASQLSEYAYLIFSRREALEKRMQDAARWLEGIRSHGLCELRKRLADPQVLLDWTEKQA